MAHERSHARMQQRGNLSPSKPQLILMNLQKDIRAMNASILIIFQKMKFLVRNEKILGRNLLVVNKKLKELEAGGSGAAGSGDVKGIRDELARLSFAMQENSERLAELQASVERIKESYAKSEELKEIKYVIDSINPLEFVTIKELDSAVEERLASRKPKK